jgi:hypothetical protein
MPDPEVWDMGMVEQKVLMRRYFTTTSGRFLNALNASIISLQVSNNGRYTAELLQDCG